MKFCSSTQTDYPFIANGVLIVGNAQSAALRAHCPGLGKKLILRTSYMKFSRTLFTIRSGGGITLSGGEPLQQKDFALDILQKCREHRIHTAVETNLLTDVNTLEAFLPWVDLWMCDFKMADDTLHRKWTGHSNVPIIKNLEFLAKQAVPLTIRTPVIPNVNDSEEAIESICRFIRQLPNQPAYELLGFHSLGFVKFENLGMKNPLSNSAFLKKGQLQKLNEILIRYNLNNN